MLLLGMLLLLWLALLRVPLLRVPLLRLLHQGRHYGSTLVLCAGRPLRRADPIRNRAEEDKDT